MHALASNNRHMPSPTAIAMRLHALRTEMRRCATLMRDHGGAEYDQHAAELDGAADKVREWCDSIQKESK